MSTAIARLGLPIEHVRLGLCALFGLGFLALAIPAFAEPMTFWTGIVLGDYMYPTHELHHLVLGTVFPVLLLGVIVQAIRPTRRVGALHSSIIVWLSAVVVLTIGGEFSPMFVVLLGLLVGMALAHPTGAAQLPSLETFDRQLGLVAVVTAIVAIGLAGLELSAQLTANDAHVGFGHYQFMALTWLSIAGLGVYGSFRGIGWRYPVYAAAVLLGVIGLASVIYPGAEQGSSLGVALGLLAVLWALFIVVVAERPESVPGIGSL